MSPKFLTAFLAVLMLAYSSSTATNAEVVLQCGQTLIRVEAATSDQAADTCAAALVADTRFAELGLRNDAPLLIKVMETLDVASGHCVAFYDTEKGVIQVLPTHCLEGNGERLGPFPHLSAPVLFDSLIVHELAHAYAERTAGDRLIPRVAHEYIAYALQLDQLPTDARNAILAIVDMSEPVDLDALNEASLSFAPHRFAARAWLHFESEGGNAEVIRRVLTGEMTFYSLRE